MNYVALFTRAWIEIPAKQAPAKLPCVALFTRAWIEMYMISDMGQWYDVALFTRAWIEISFKIAKLVDGVVALFTRAWIEMLLTYSTSVIKACRPLHEGVD